MNTDASKSDYSDFPDEYSKVLLEIIMLNYLASDVLPATFLARPKKGGAKEGRPGDHSDPSCSVVLGTFQKLGLRPQTV